jgi:hypothetical protein
MLVFYLHIILAVLVQFYFLNSFIKQIHENVTRWFPKSMYINNERCLKETGQPDKYFVEWKYPDLYNTKHLAIRYLLKKETLASCFVYTFLVMIFQTIAHIVFDFIVRIGSFRREEYFILTVVIIDYAAFMACTIAIIISTIEGLKTETKAIKSNDRESRKQPTQPNEQAIEQLKDFMLEGRIAIQSRNIKKPNE